MTHDMHPVQVLRSITMPHWRPVYSCAGYSEMGRSSLRCSISLAKVGVCLNSSSGAERTTLRPSSVQWSCVLTSVCNSGLGQTAINVAGTAVFAKFSRDDEREADQEAITNVIRAGIHPDGIPEMFEILLAERTRNPSAVDGWFGTHPLEEERVQATRAAISQINPAVLRTLTRDSRNYQNFKARVRALPPSPRPRQ